MAQVKLELAQRDDADLQTFTATHIAMITGNADFPTPTPAPAAVATALSEFGAAIVTAQEKESEAREATQIREAKRGALSQALNDRAAYVQTASGGDEAKILSVGFGVRAQPSPVGPLPAPVDFMPTMGDMPGEIDLSWSRVNGARTYVIEHREAGTTVTWTQKMSTKSRLSVDGLTSGKTYAFRVAAVGTAGQGPWSLEAARMAP